MPGPASFKDAFDDAFADICGGVDVYYAGKSFLCTAVVAVGGRRKASGWTPAPAGSWPWPHAPASTAPTLGLHGNNKSDAEIHRALDMGLGRIVVDSLDELDRVAKIAVRPRRNGQRHAAADPRRARAHPRVHRHRPRGPEVRSLHGRGHHRAGRTVSRGGGRGCGRELRQHRPARACTATSARRSSSRTALRWPPRSSCASSPPCRKSTPS